MPVDLSHPEETPLVSILISNYNHVEYIGKAVSSALQQSYPNIEVIICDDGSTDHSINVLDSIANIKGRRLVILKKENGGQASAVNAAFQISSGKIICFLDSDDFFYRHKVAKVVQAFRNHSDAGFLIHRLDKIDSRGRKFGQLPMSVNLPSGWYNEYVMTNGTSPSGFPVTSGLVLRREVAFKIFPVHEKIIYDVDEVIRRIALLTTRVEHINESLGVYRIHGNNLTSMDIRKRLKKMLPIYEVIWNETKKCIEDTRPQEASRFPGINEDIHHLLMNYVLKRLHQDIKASTEYWEKIETNRSFKAWPSSRRNFWLFTVRMPDFIFEHLVTLYWGSGGLKLRLSKLQHYLKQIKK